MALAFEKRLIPGPERPQATQDEREDRELDVSVVFTSVPGTLSALKQAGVLARKLGARITLLVPQIVPYPLPLASPPVLLEFSEKRFFTIASESHVETTVRIYLCRDRFDAIAKVLRPNSLVVLGGRKRWWLTSELRIGRKLRGLGHEVLFVETE